MHITIAIGDGLRFIIKSPAFSAGRQERGFVGLMEWKSARKNPMEVLRYE